MILATHHVEEIVPAFTHVLVLKGGRVLAAGEKGKVLTSRILSKAFGAVIRARQRHGRYELSVVPRVGAVV
jgi:iron complex transport system ATP-binding protein